MNQTEDDVNLEKVMDGLSSLPVESQKPRLAISWALMRNYPRVSPVIADIAAIFDKHKQLLQSGLSAEEYLKKTASEDLFHDSRGPRKNELSKCIGKYLGKFYVDVKEAHMGDVDLNDLSLEFDICSEALMQKANISMNREHDRRESFEDDLNRIPYRGSLF